jgi:HK97 family phage major capsid protein
MRLLELRKSHKELLDKAEGFVQAAETANRPMTSAETAGMTAAMKEAEALVPQIQGIEKLNTLRPGARGFFGSVPQSGATHLHHAPRITGPGAAPLSAEYSAAFLALLRSGGKQASDALSEGFDPLFSGFALPSLPGMSSAMYEGTGGGSNGAGGYAINIPTDGQIVPLAVPDLGVRSLARAISTATDIKIPSQSTFGTAGVKAESGASSNTFSESDPTLGQFTLSAYMMGLTHTVSWELLQDVAMFQEFGVRDLLNAVAIAEDGFFVTGTGTGQPQGLVGNTATGTGAPYLVESTGVYLLNAIDDILGTLKGPYFPNAAWLMSRATATAIRKAQRQANLFAPVWTREGGRDLLHGFPVSYSSNMPALPTATTSGVTPILFGSFQDGYIIGDRGGAGTFVKILDQPLATAGQTILLGYKRVDGRVRRSEAIQAISISHS